MAFFNVLAWFVAAASLALMAFGLSWLAWPLLGATALVAIVPIINKPVFNESPDDVRTRRVVAAFAIAFAAVPVVQPFIAGAARWNRERLENRRCAPLFPKAQSAASAVAPALVAFRRQQGAWPTLDAVSTPPLVDGDGKVINVPPGAGGPLLAPDPFARGTGQTMRLVALGDVGVLVASVGPNGVFELPDVAELASMDPPPADPSAMLLATGIEWSRLGWWQGKSPLEPGDVLQVVDGSGQVMAGETMLVGVIEAWKQVAAESPASMAPGAVPDAEADALAARRLFDKGRYGAALAAASRARRWRPPYPAQWKTPGLSSIDRTRGLAFYELGHYRHAADALLDYLARHGGDGEAQYYLGAAMFRGGDPLQARHGFAAAIQVDPASPPVAPAMAALAAMDRGAAPALPPARGVTP